MNQNPPTALDLDEIASRAAHLYEYVNVDVEGAQPDFDKLTGTDVGVLLAKVRRLQAQSRFLLGALARKDAASGEAAKALREFLAAEPEVHVQPTGYLVSRLPVGHDDRWTFTVQVQHAGGGKFAVRHGIRHYGTDGTWSYEPSFDEDDDAAELEWLAAHRFDHDEALRLAKQLAPTLTYRGRSVADVLATPAPAVSGGEQ